MFMGTPSADKPVEIFHQLILVLKQQYYIQCIISFNDQKKPFGWSNMLQ